MNVAKRFGYVVLLVITVFISACGGSNNSEGGGFNPGGIFGGNPGPGEPVYAENCAACHGPDGGGITGLGSDLLTSEFMRVGSEEEIVTFITETQPVSGSPDGGLVHIEGSNPDISEEDAINIIAYLKYLREQ